MSDLHDLIETVLMRVAMLLLFGLIAWAGSTVAIGLAIGAARTMTSMPAIDWAEENAALLALFLAGLGYGLLLVRPAANER